MYVDTKIWHFQIRTTHANYFGQPTNYQHLMLHKKSVHFTVCQLDHLWHVNVYKCKYRARLCLLVHFVAADCYSYFLRKHDNFCMPDNSSEIERGVKFGASIGGLLLGLLVGNALCANNEVKSTPSCDSSLTLWAVKEITKIVINVVSLAFSLKWGYC